jgi:hypothetical protein
MELEPLVIASELWAAFHSPIYSGLFEDPVAEIYRQISSADTLLPFVQVMDSIHILPESGLRASVTSVLTSTTDFGCTKVHDRIYGLLGLRIFEGLGLVPDYDSPVERAYIAFTKQLLDQKSDISWLCLTHQNPLLPSWVPDFKVKSPIRWEKTQDLLAKYFPPAASISLADNTLKAEGALYDTISTAALKALMVLSR